MAVVHCHVPHNKVGGDFIKAAAPRQLIFHQLNIMGTWTFLLKDATFICVSSVLKLMNLTGHTIEGGPVIWGNRRISSTADFVGFLQVFLLKKLGIFILDQ